MKTYILTLSAISVMVLMLGLEQVQAANNLYSPSHSLQMVAKNVDQNKAGAVASVFGGGR